MTTPAAISPGRSTARPVPALLALGFRPFYLLAAAIAMAGAGVWIVQWLGWMPAVTTPAPMLWHAHEMVFGFAVAVIAGFLFTAARNWTGEATPTGLPLALLCALWLFARIAQLTGPAALAGGADAAFLLAVAGALWVPLHKTRNRNRVLLLFLLLLAGADGLFHLGAGGVLDVSPLTGVRIALYGVVLLVAVMGGRVIPSFTANALPHAGVRTHRKLDLVSIAGAGAAFVAVVAVPSSPLTGVLCAVAAGLHLLRLRTWAPLATRRTPILWVLHVSYAWIPVGLGLHALQASGLLDAAILADHALGVGAVGGVILGMITRTARGHTGRPLKVGCLETMAYALLITAAGLRVLVPAVIPEAARAAIALAGLLWVAAFALYLIVYVPWLARPRADGRPG